MKKLAYIHPTITKRKYLSKVLDESIINYLPFNDNVIIVGIIGGAAFGCPGNLSIKPTIIFLF